MISAWEGDATRVPIHRHGGLIKYAGGHLLTARFSCKKNFLFLLSCIHIDSSFTKAIAFEVLRICFKNSSYKNLGAAMDDASSALRTSTKLNEFHAVEFIRGISRLSKDI
jgi:hypothetical protein